MTDIVERLREHSSYIRAFTEEGMSEIERQSMSAMADAAVEISTLRERTEIAEQRTAAAERVKDSEIALRVAAIDTIAKLRAEVEELRAKLEPEAAPPPKPPCVNHDWHYSGTDYHGSHKGEDSYSCHNCGAWEYRP